MKLTKLNELIENGKRLKGRWEIGPNHEIVFRRGDPSGRPYTAKDEEIKVRGSLVAAEPQALVIAVTERQSDQNIVTGLWKLAGKWRTDPKNQIVFEVGKESGKNDVLSFTGGWRVGEFQELLYTYEVRDLKTKRKELKLLVFQGAWDITEKNRLAYRLGGGSDPAFYFRAALQSKSILAKKGEIRYQAGLEVSGKRQTQDIVLFGKWKYSDKLGLFFEMEYEAGRKKSIGFGGDYSLASSRSVSVELKTAAGRPLGIELVLTQDVFGKDGQAFIRFKKSIEEGSRIEAGAQFKF